MGNIVGEGFDSRITGQVNRRQKTHGSGYNGETLRTNEELVVLNNNTAWVKLMSSVSIDDINSINNPTIKGFGKKGADISKAFVLFNGTSAYDNNKTIQRGGIDFTNTLGGYDNVYGIGGSADFGLNPMMGITGIDVKHKNRGSIRTATVTVKAFNRAQFEIIDVLYMRLGFSVLLEWGNSIYMDNNDKYISDGGNENSLIDDWFKDSDYVSFLSKIRNKSLSSHGNYDAMLAKVSNYHWSFQKDGSYDITIDLVSMGDVVESFKMDAAAANLQPPASFTGSSYPAKIVNARDKHKLGAYLYDELNYINSIIAGGMQQTAAAGSKFVDVDEDDPTKTVQHRSSFNENTDGDDMFFLRMGDLLYWIQENQMYKSNSKSILTFDYAYKDNLMGIHKIDDVPLYNTGNQFDTWPNNHVLHQVSYDPFTCIALQFFDPTPSHITSIHGGMDNSLDDRASIGTRANANANFNIQDTFEKKINNEYYGKIMNIYLNFEFLLDTMEDKIDEDGNVLLIDFLKSVLKGVNEAFGGINDLQVTIDSITNKVRIIDVNPLHSPKNLIDYFKLESTSANFNLYGYNKTNGESNFIHDFNLTTEITPALSTMITVAATSNKTVVGEDNTSLSKINKGLSDRYRKDLEEPPSLTIPKLALPPQSYTPNMLQFLKLAYGCDGDTNSMKLIGTDIDYTAPGGLFQHVVAVSAMFAVKAQCDIYKRKAKKIFQLYNNIKKGIINGNELTPVGKSGFIPFNLSLTMDGLGGMKIYQKFNVDTDFMPSNYPSSIEFLIKNIQHTVKDNKWITKIESFCVSKPGSNVTQASTPTVTSAGLGGGGGAITGTNPKSSGFGGLRGDLFSWVPGPNYPNPSDPNNYNGTIYINPAFTENKRKELLNFQINDYIVAILNSPEAKIIARPQNFISKPTIPVTIKKTKTVKNKKTYTYNTLFFDETEQEKMFTNILKGIGATNSKYNLLWMKVWRIAEGSTATYNPWNSTQPVINGIPSTRFNSVGVQNYFTFQDGVDATIKTMTNGHYPYIIKALKKGIQNYAEMKELATLVQLWDMTGKIPPKWQ